MSTPRPTTRKLDRSGLMRSITTPLGFYVLALLIIEATLAVVLSFSKLNEVHVWEEFLCMLGVFIGVVSIVSLFAALAPKKLLYGKEEHREPLLEPSALKDQIEDLIAANVQPESLKLPER